MLKGEGCFVWRYKGFEMLQEWIDEPVPRLSLYRCGRTEM